MKHICMLTILTLVINTTVGQQVNYNISGVVIDSASQLPLPNAIVSIIESNKNTVTSNKGIFNFQSINLDSFRIKVDYIGYKSLITNNFFANGTSITLKPLLMSLEKKALQSVVIKASKPLIVNTPNGITLNVSESIVSIGSNAFDILLNAPGVIANQNGNIQINGRGTTIYIDGRLTNLSGEELKTLLSNMPSSSIEKIEIITNPSAKFDAIGGIVINIKTSKNKNFGTNGTISSFIGAGENFRGGTGINLNNRTKKVNIYGSYDFQHNTQFYKNISIRYINPIQTIHENEYDIRNRNNHSYKLGVDIDLSKKSTFGILARGFTNYRERKVTNNTINIYKGGEDSFSVVNTWGKARFNSPSINLYFKTILDSLGEELTVNLDLFKYQKNWSDDFITDYFTINNTNFKPPLLLKDYSPANNHVKSLTADYSRNLKKWRLEAGIKGVLSKTDNDITWLYFSNKWETDQGKTNRFIYNENVFAGYLSISGKIKKIAISAGIRTEHTRTSGESVTISQINTREYTNLFPNINLQYSKAVNTQLGLSYRKNIVRYGFDLVNPFIVYQSQYSYSQGNPELKPQINHTIDFSWSYKNKLNTSVSYTHGINSLAPVYKQNNATSQLISSYDNLASSDIASMNISLTKSVKKWTTINNIGTFLIKYNLDKLENPSSRSKASATIYTTSYNTISFKKGINAEIVMVYRSPIVSGIFKINEVFTSNFGISKQISQGNGSLKLNISDVFNTQKVVSIVDGYQGVTGEFTNKPESRFISLSFSWKFGKKLVKASRNRKTGIDDERGRMGSN
jgi:hypothetical protein